MTTNILPLGIVVLASTLIMGCSQENTINDAGNGAMISCTESCVSVQLAVDNTENLNYTCGSVRNVTNNVGLASCPVGSVINYFVQASSLTAKSKIDLGSYTISSSASAGTIVRITPLDLSSSGANATATNNTAINITRLLMSLHEIPYISNAPTNQISVLDTQKDLLETIYPNETVSVATFATEDGFTAKFQPWINAMNQANTGKTYQLASYNDANAQLMRGLNVIKAGIYFGTPVTNPLKMESTVNLGISGTGTDGSDVAVGMYLLTDREGYGIGQGLKWSGKKGTNTSYVVYLNEQFAKMHPKSDSNPHFNVFSNKVEDFKWDILQTSGVISQQFQINTGRLYDNRVLTGNEALYRAVANVPASTIVDASELGSWATTGGSNNLSGTATLYKGFAVDNFLDPDVWKTADTVAAGAHYVFPLHLTLDFKYGAAIPATSSTDAVAALPGCSAGCELQKQSITILSNGNVISDMNQDCSAVDTTTLKDSLGAQEYRLGLVRTAYTNTSNDAFISMALLFSGAQFNALDGVQVGTQIFAPLSKLNIKALIGSLASGSSAGATVNITDSSTADTLDSGSAAAVWGNVYNAYTRQYEAYNTPKGQTTVFSDNANRSQGTLTATLTPCYQIH